MNLHLFVSLVVPIGSDISQNQMFLIDSWIFVSDLLEGNEIWIFVQDLVLHFLKSFEVSTDAPAGAVLLYRNKT